jgi:hypothetical protein
MKDTESILGKTAQHSTGFIIQEEVLWRESPARKLEPQLLTDWSRYRRWVEKFLEAHCAAKSLTAL